MKTQTIGNEILFNLTPASSVINYPKLYSVQIQASFDKFGLKNAERGVFAVIINLTPSFQQELKQKIAEICLGEIDDLTKHVEF